MSEFEKICGIISSTKGLIISSFIRRSHLAFPRTDLSCYERVVPSDPLKRILSQIRGAIILLPLFSFIVHLEKCMSNATFYNSPEVLLEGTIVRERKCGPKEVTSFPSRYSALSQVGTSGEAQAPDVTSFKFHKRYRG